MLAATPGGKVVWPHLLKQQSWSKGACSLVAPMGGLSRFRHHSAPCPPNTQDRRCAGWGDRPRPARRASPTHADARQVHAHWPPLLDICSLLDAWATVLLGTPGRPCTDGQPLWSWGAGGAARTGPQTLDKCHRNVCGSVGEGGRLTLLQEGRGEAGSTDIYERF